jgi:hypothetical protein
MLRLILTCALAGSTALAQSAGAPPAGAGPRPPATPAPGQQNIVTTADTLPQDAAVVTIKGLCAEVKVTDSAKPASCETRVTKEAMNRLVAAVSFGDHQLNRVTTRTFAQDYAQTLALSTAALELGLDKDPSFQELLRYERLRTLADAYRRYLQQKYSKPTAEQYEAYYKQNLEKFTRLQVEHVVVPKINPVLPRQEAAEFTKRAEKAANEIRERAARGEETRELLTEAYKSLELGVAPRTDMGAVTRGSFAGPLWEQISVLRAGQVTSLESLPGGFSFYKVKAHDVIPLEAVKDTLTKELSQRLAQAELQELLGGIHSELNMEFFNSQPLGAPPVVSPRAPLHSPANPVPQKPAPQK